MNFDAVCCQVVETLNRRACAKVYSHQVLRLLLERWYEYSTCPRLQGPHLHRAAALFGDLETIKILTATDHFKIKYDKSYVLADCLEKYSEHYHVTEESIAAFRTLLKDPDSFADIDSLLESGLLNQQMHDKNEFIDYFDNDSGIDADSDGLWEDAVEKLELSESSEKSQCLLIDVS